MADTWCEFFDESNKARCGWLCDVCKIDLSCRARTLRPKMALREKIDANVTQMFEHTGWKLVKGARSEKITVLLDECSIEFHLESEIKV